MLSHSTLNSKEYPNYQIIRIIGTDNNLRVKAVVAFKCISVK